MNASRPSLRVRTAVAIALLLLATPARPDSPIPAGPPTPLPAHGEADCDRWIARTQACPTDASAWLRLGDGWMQRSRVGDPAPSLARAGEAYRKALDLEPRNPLALVGLAWVANTRHDFDAGRRGCREALAIDPRLPEAHALLADAAIEAGEYDEALDHCQAALDARPDLASYARASHVLWMTGDTPRAQLLMQKAIDAGAPHAENTAWCRAELARMRFQQGALLAAEPLLAAALREVPEHPAFLVLQGRLRAARGDLPGAIASVEAAARLQPRVSTLALLVDLHRAAGDDARAEAGLRTILDQHPAHRHEPSPGAPADHVHAGDAELALVLADHGLEPDRALHEAEEAARESRSVAVTGALAWCYHVKGLEVEALRTVRRALRWHTPDPELHYRAGLIHARLGDRAAAQRHLSTALQLNPAFHPLLAPRARNVLEKLGSARTATETAAAAAPGTHGGLRLREESRTAARR